MSDAPMAAVEALCIYTVQLPHTARKISLRRFDQQVIVIVHEAVSVAMPGEAGHGFTQSTKERLTIRFITKDRFAGFAARSDVVDRSGEL